MTVVYVNGEFISKEEARSQCMIMVFVWRRSV